MVECDEWARAKPEMWGIVGKFIFLNLRSGKKEISEFMDLVERDEHIDFKWDKDKAVEIFNKGISISEIEESSSFKNMVRWGIVQISKIICFAEKLFPDMSPEEAVFRAMYEKRHNLFSSQEIVNSLDFKEFFEKLTSAKPYRDIYYNEEYVIKPFTYPLSAIKVLNNDGKERKIENKEIYGKIKGLYDSFNDNCETSGKLRSKWNSLVNQFRREYEKKWKDWRF